VLPKSVVEKVAKQGSSDGQAQGSSRHQKSSSEELAHERPVQLAFDHSEGHQGCREENRPQGHRPLRLPESGEDLHQVRPERLDEEGGKQELDAPWSQGRQDIAKSRSHADGSRSTPGYTAHRQPEKPLGPERCAKKRPSGAGPRRQSRTTAA
jgi:hypothetical protein